MNRGGGGRWKSMISKFIWYVWCSKSGKSMEHASDVFEDERGWIPIANEKMNISPVFACSHPVQTTNGIVEQEVGGMQDDKLVKKSLSCRSKKSCIYRDPPRKFSDFIGVFVYGEIYLELKSPYGPSLYRLRVNHNDEINPRCCWMLATYLKPFLTFDFPGDCY